MCMVHLVCDAGKNDIIDNVLKSLFLTLLIDRYAKLSFSVENNSILIF